MAKKKDKKDNLPVDTEQIFEDSVSRLEAWYYKNQKLITAFIAIVILAVGGYFGYRFLYQEPRERVAQEEMFMAQNFFEADSLNWALNGHGMHLGFVDIINNFRGTRAANLSHSYVGIIYMRKGRFEDALHHLKRFRSNDLILTPMVGMLIADAYAELGNYSEALRQYERAASSHVNDMVTPMILMRAAALAHIQGDYQRALRHYERVRTEFVRSPEAQDIDKHIALLQAKINQ
ncbi:MAG: tetratricopeptide repeat protein [Bacteroidales bacterium]|nr:tetratricopeptide repeat protein [Bacteroidales bacterium]